MAKAVCSDFSPRTALRIALRLSKGLNVLWLVQRNAEEIAQTALHASAGMTHLPMVRSVKREMLRPATILFVSELHVAIRRLNPYLVAALSP